MKQLVLKFTFDLTASKWLFYFFFDIKLTSILTILMLVKFELENPALNTESLKHNMLLKE